MNSSTTLDIEDPESCNQQQQQRPQKGATFLKTCFNGTNALAGIGILSVPYALSEGGWLSLILLLTVALLCSYTGILLHRCMLSSSQAKTYPDIGNLAFGYKGRIIVSIFMYLELYLAAVEYLILEGDNFTKLFFPQHDTGRVVVGGMKIRVEQVFIILTAVAVLPTTWLRNLRLLAYVSVGGVLASVVLICSVFWVGAIDGVGFDSERGRMWNWSGLPTAISMFVFCYSGLAVFPTLSNSMDDKTKLSKVLLVCFLLSSMTYGSMAILGYSMYGEDLKSQVTLNLPNKRPASLTAIYTTLIIPLTKYAIVVCPISEAIENNKFFNHGGSKLASIIIRTMIVVTTAIVALIVPFFGYVMAFAGAFLSVTASILLPCLCYLKICRTRRFEAVFVVLILIVGVTVAVMGTFVSIRDILGEFNGSLHDNEN